VKNGGSLTTTPGINFFSCAVIIYGEISKKLVKWKSNAYCGKSDRRASAPVCLCDDACDIMLTVCLA